MNFFGSDLPGMEGPSRVHPPAGIDARSCGTQPDRGGAFLISASSRQPFLVIQPGRDEAYALRLTAHFFGRVGTRTTTEVLDPRALADDASLRHGIRDNLFAAAVLCDSLVALPESDRHRK